MPHSPLPISNDIAIIGMSALFPGAKDIHDYWHNILNKVDNLHEAPDEWASPYFDPQTQPREDPARIYTRKVGLLGNLATFNPLEFGIPPSSVDGDPSHFLALKLARDALKDANYLDRPFNREMTGVILGRGSNPNRGDVTGTQYGLVLDQTISLLSQLLPQLNQETLTEIRQELQASLPSVEIEKAPSLVSNVATGRIANRLDLMGPNYLVDAACSSCLIAVEQAIRELLAGRSDMMLAGGVQGSMPPLIYQLFCQLNALSRTNIRPFDRQANGTLLSEGAGFLVLKRLADAQRDGDRVYAVIKGVGISSDGRAMGLLAPRCEGEVLALHRAYEQTGIDPSTIGLIEAHGTGIPLGDKTEIKSLTKIFGKRGGIMPRCAMGSVKSMIGHCIPASGVASLVKTALSLYYQVLPPTLCDEVNPDLELENTPFYINNETRPWIHGANYPRRAGVNAFGFGGINAHAILEEYRPNREWEMGNWELGSVNSSSVVASETKLADHNQSSPLSSWPSELIIFTGNSREEILSSINQVQNFVAVNQDTKLANLAYTLANQTAGTHRLAIIAKNIDDLVLKLHQVTEKLTNIKKTKLQTRNGIYYSQNQTDTGKTAFLFSSEGAQYPNMLMDLCLYFPQVRGWFEFLDQTFPREMPPSQFIFPAPTSLTTSGREWIHNQLYAGDLATEALFSASMGLYELLGDLGIECDVMVGHSAGEHIAARASGLAHFASKAQLKQQLQHLNHIYRDLAVTNTIAKGVLMSVGAVDYQLIERLIANSNGSVHLVADNCPNQVLLFAQETESQAVMEQIKAVGGICIPLPFDRAYHTPLFQPVMEALRTHYNAIEAGQMKATLYSCATTEPYPTDPQAARILCAQQWVLPVRFRETIEKVYADGVRTFIEVGAGSNLTAFVDNTLQGRDYLAIAGNTPRKSGLSQVQTLLAKLFVAGKTINMNALYKHRQVITLNFHEPVTAPSGPSPILNLLLPKMSLTPEFVTKVHRQLELGNSPPQTSSEHKQELVETQETTLPPTTQTSTQNQYGDFDTNHQNSPHSGQEVPLEFEALTPDSSLSILKGHFELMDEFLAHQGRVTNLLFDSSENNHAGNHEQN